MTSAIRSFALVGGRVIDGEGGPAQNATVLVRDGLIRAILPESQGARSNLSGEMTDDVAQIDVTGKTVMPGLIDSHCHISFDEPASNDELFFHRRQGLAAIVAAYNVRKVVRAGVTGMLDADCLWEISTDLRDAVEAGIVDGPRMAVGGNALVTSVGGTAGRLIHDRGRTGYARVVQNRDEIITEVRQEIKSGVDWIKVHVTGLVPRRPEQGEMLVWSLDELRAVCDTAHALGIPVVGHCRNATSIRDAVRAGFDMILHATHMDEEALEHVIDAKPYIVPTLTFQANLADYGRRIGASPEVIDVFKREIAESAEMLRRAYDAGVPMLAGSESGFALTPYGEWHHRELEVFVRHLGMTPLEAITCATRNGAPALGLEGRTGVIAEGMEADLIVVNGEPDRDIEVLGRPGAIEDVYIGGRRVDTTPPPQPRGTIRDWRVSGFAQTILTRAVAWGEAGST